MLEIFEWDYFEILITKDYQIFYLVYTVFNIEI